MNMAIDEAILRARIESIAPNTLRFYCWKPSAVSIGKFQNMENEVRVENCKKQGVDVVRRITGGGTVYHDTEGEITYSVIAKEDDLGGKDIAVTYARIYAGLAEAIKILGVTANFGEGNIKTCPNLTVNGRKISGSAQCHKSGVVLQHGTLLIKVDLQRMFTLLSVPWTENCMEIVKIGKRKITSINAELGKEISVTEVHNASIKGFKKALRIEFVNGELTPYELELAEKLGKEKYATPDWTSDGSSIYFDRPAKV
jgi:lipoate-protein ligase A